MPKENYNINELEDLCNSLIAGEKRVRNYKIDEIKSMLKKLYEYDLLSLQEGILFKQLQLSNEYSLRKLSSIIDKNKNYIATRLNLTKFSNDCKEFIITHQINNISMLSRILKLEETLHMKYLEKLLNGTLIKDDIEKFEVKIAKLDENQTKKTTISINIVLNL